MQQEVNTKDTCQHGPPKNNRQINRLSQPERIGSLLTDSLRQIKETLGHFLTGLSDSS